MSFLHFSSLLGTSRQLSANFRQFLAILINFHQFLPIFTNFTTFSSICANFSQFQPISVNFGQFVKRNRQFVKRDKQFVKSKQSTYLSRFYSFRIQLCTNADNYFVVTTISRQLLYRAHDFHKASQFGHPLVCLDEKHFWTRAHAPYGKLLIRSKAPFPCLLANVGMLAV